MKYFKRILFFLSLFILYVIAKEFLQLYTMLHTLHPFVAYLFAFLCLWLFSILSPSRFSAS